MENQLSKQAQELFDLYRGQKEDGYDLGMFKMLLEGNNNEIEDYDLNRNTNGYPEREEIEKENELLEEIISFLENQNEEN